MSAAMTTDSLFKQSHWITGVDGRHWLSEFVREILQPHLNVVNKQLTTYKKKTNDKINNILIDAKADNTLLHKLDSRVQALSKESELNAHEIYELDEFTRDMHKDSVDLDADVRKMREAHKSMDARLQRLERLLQDRMSRSVDGPQTGSGTGVAALFV
jgi:hypothetical protein